MASILVVDDEADARELLVVGLRRHGHEVSAAANGEEALAHRTGIDVMITDLVMPRMDGLALLAALAARRSQVIKLVITSFADKERSIAALNSGAHYLVEKPFGVRQIADLIDKLLRDRAEEPVIERMVVRHIDGLGLGTRERQLVLYVLKGLSNADIARVAGVSEQTIKNYLHALYRKLGISSRGELFHLIFPV